jgi:hypothetical protein
MALSRYICIYITRDRTIRDVTTIHAADDSEACEQAMAGCLARRDVDLGYELWRPKRWVAAYYPKGPYAAPRHPVAARMPEASA